MSCAVLGCQDLCERPLLMCAAPVTPCCVGLAALRRRLMWAIAEYKGALLDVLISQCRIIPWAVYSSCMLICITTISIGLRMPLSHEEWHLRPLSPS